jgi:hypothetical protein
MQILKYKFVIYIKQLLSLPEEVTNFLNSADKIIWTKFGVGLKEKSGNFITARVGK